MLLILLFIFFIFFITYNLYINTTLDFSTNHKDKEKELQNSDEKMKLEVQLALSKRIIDKFLKTWPGYSMFMGDYMAINSIIESLNTDTNIIIKKTVLDLIKDLIENEYQSLDNFTTSIVGDEFYIHKVYLAYVLEGLHKNQLYNSLIKFIEKDNNPLSEYVIS